MKKTNIKWLIKIILISLAASVVFTLASTEILGNTGYIISFIVLALFIIVGIVFDVIGIAVTAGNEAPFNSMATRRQRGAAESLRLIKNANKVTCYCNDVIGDVTGIVSGTTAALIAAKLMDGFNTESLIFPVVISAVVTGVTVGGKAVGKTLAFNKSTEIVHSAGRILSYLKIMPFSNQDKQEKPDKLDKQEKPDKPDKQDKQSE
ncbi:MAG: hypothetical protein FWD38_11875 [Oscillospiraceae bacterium]|nr:hypothetical protein [Oscillospiraceae bacterium]